MWVTFNAVPDFIVIWIVCKDVRDKSPKGVFLGHGAVHGINDDRGVAGLHQRSSDQDDQSEFTPLLRPAIVKYLKL